MSHGARIAASRGQLCSSWRPPSHCSVLYTVLALYIEQVLPSRFRAYGIPKPWYFPCLPRFWRGLCCRRAPAGGSAERLMPGAKPSPLSIADASAHEMASATPSIEAPDAELRDREAAGRAVAVSRLRKEFNTPDGVKVAVDGVNCVFYEGQISVLLGECGA